VTLRDEVRMAMGALAEGGPAEGGAPRAGRGTTSDLTIDETLLLHSAGWEPVDLVFGVSWWSIPWGVWQWGRSGEVDEASSAFSGAADQAATLLRQECVKVGGVGVLGVEIDFRVSSRRVAIEMSGTAVKRTEGDHHDFEFISDLSARDFVLLTRAGWWPLGLAAGASFVIAPARTARQWASQQGRNMELPNLTQALYLARERAMERMQRAGAGMNAEGIVGVRLREGRASSSIRVMQFVAIGTGVHLRSGTHQSIAPMMVVPLDERVRQFDVKSLRSTGRGAGG
jgi:uncharacterized protein YbjQ (UPF0145 family)